MKVLFFIIVYLMSMLLCCFIGKQFALLGTLSSFLLGSLVIFCSIIVSCFLVALMLLLLFKYSYLACCRMFKIEETGLFAFSRSFWIIFTGFVYLVMFIIFLKFTGY